MTRLFERVVVDTNQPGDARIYSTATHNISVTGLSGVKKTVTLCINLFPQCAMFNSSQ